MKTVRALFVAYLAVIALGLAWAITVGVLGR